MFSASHDQFRKMKDLGYNVEGQTQFPDTEPNHKFFRIAKEKEWEVLKVCTI